MPSQTPSTGDYEEDHFAGLELGDNTTDPCNLMVESHLAFPGDNGDASEGVCFSKYRARGILNRRAAQGREHGRRTTG
jgi:hypothetical protein